MTINRVRICFTWPLSSRVLQCFHKATIRLYCWCCCGILCKSKAVWCFFLLLIWYKITWKWKKKKKSVHQSFYCFGVSVTISHDFVSLFLSLQFCSLLFSMATSIITLPPCDFPKKFFPFFPFIDEYWKLFCIFSCYDGSWLSRTPPHISGSKKASLFYVFLLISLWEFLFWNKKETVDIDQYFGSSFS